MTEARELAKAFFRGGFLSGRYGDWRTPDEAWDAYVQLGEEMAKSGLAESAKLEPSPKTIEQKGRSQ